MSGGTDRPHGLCSTSPILVLSLLASAAPANLRKVCRWFLSKIAEQIYAVALHGSLSLPTPGASPTTVGGAAFFEGVHVFTSHSDVPDDSALRLILLPPDKWYSREEGRLAFDAVLEVIRSNGPKPR